MFADANSKTTRRIYNEQDDLWALHISTPEYWAWKHWLTDQFGYSSNIHSNWLTVWTAWPPTTVASACRVAQRISDMRDELRILTPVPRRPEAWDGIIAEVPELYRDMRVD